MRKEPGRCGLLDTPLDSAYRDYGLDLSQEAIEGPMLQHYPFGASVSTETERRVRNTGKGHKVSYHHSIMIEGPFWGDFDVSFTSEGLMNRVSKLFGRVEIQGGDPLFDDKIYVRADANDARLRRFVELDPVQSALLTIILGQADGHVIIQKGLLRTNYATSESGELTNYKNAILPSLALARWACEL